MPITVNKEVVHFFSKNLKRLIDGLDLRRTDSRECLQLLLDHKLGIANDVCFGAFFAAMQTKEPTIEEVLGLFEAVNEFDRISLEIERKFTDPLCGIVGSGKDDIKTFNISSISAIVAAAAGVRVLKNGSRSESSVAGTTDVR